MRDGFRPIAELFTDIIATERHLPALVQDGNVTTFTRWWLDSSVIATALAELGVVPGDVVVLLLPSGQDFATAYLAAARLGAVVSGVNPRLGAAEIEHILRRAEPTVIVTDTPQRLADVPYPVRTPDELRGTAPSIEGWATVPSDSPAVLVWTSGSTGLPKGVWFDHETLGFIAANGGPLSAWHDRKLMPVPFAHAGYLTRVHDQLLHRITLVLTPAVWSAETMLDVLESERVTVGQGVPTQWEKLVALDRLDRADLSHLRLVSTGASRVPATLVRALRERLRCPVVVRYASTEVPLAFGTGIDDPAETAATTVGRPLGGAEVQIRDVDGQPLPQGHVGQVFLRSAARMRGYWREPALTARTIDPDGWLTSNDLGRLDAAGNLIIVGRADDAYIRGGYNIHPAEVEAALAEHPRVARVAVVGTQAPVIGEIGVAFVVTDGKVSADELRQWCRERIADYKVPDIVEFVADLPVNATFKVDVGQLRERAATLRSG
ncbi:MAG TPA: class I adenylate-forming enzyme family protein [Pseudonocardiaceae bacterium]|jgi:acyl-CoA synthetase (AMP-forming)/AMP-acid ligase II